MSDFTWLNKQGVASDRGFSFQSAARFEWHYKEESVEFSLFGEPTLSGGQHGFAFSRDWEPVPTASQRPRVESNVSDAMKFMGLKAEFD